MLGFLFGVESLALSLGCDRTQLELAMETMSTAFAHLPDPLLLPWLPTLISTPRSRGAHEVRKRPRSAGRPPGDL